MKKKLVTGALLLAFGAVAVTGGTLAYFTDEDEAVNVMTTGKVNIIQNEKNRYGGDYEQNQALMPMVDNRTVDAEGEKAPIVVDGYFNPNMNNVVDKIVTVTNEGEKGAINQDAYVRTILAFETSAEYEEGTDKVLRDARTIFDTYIGVLGNGLTWMDGTVTIDGQEYVIAYKVYADPLAPGNTTDPSLKQIFLSPDADNEVALLFGSEYTILALSQGTQTTGFDSAEEALNEAFGILDGEGAVDDATLISWLSACAVA